MARTKAKTKQKTDDRPFSLYTVRRAEENTHANTTFLHCLGRTTPFAVECAGYVPTGEDVLAQWGSDGKLVSLSQAMVVDKRVKSVKHLKGARLDREVPLSLVEDLR